jgi:hypothetical protein
MTGNSLPPYRSSSHPSAHLADIPQNHIDPYSAGGLRRSQKTLILLRFPLFIELA